MTSGPGSGELLKSAQFAKVFWSSVVRTTSRILVTCHPHHFMLTTTVLRSTDRSTLNNTAKMEGLFFNVNNGYLFYFPVGFCIVKANGDLKAISKVWCEGTETVY
jgi:hypothetical protein